MAERVLSRHALRRRARRREKQLEGWQRTVRNWLRDETGDWRTALVPLPEVDMDPVPADVRAAADKLVAAGTFHTDTIKVEPRRRGLRFAVVAEH